MPKLIGVNLQLAQDMLQKKGSFLMDQEDALGLWTDSRSWTPTGGLHPEAPRPARRSRWTVVTLSSVKLAEDCP